ncbi:hypothetical protein BDN72DRAFT_965336 [Pluteus cervinus]|uniref:Uncharacterized protein n=1 Tax=Pluteus cervinus TaxID=181527 RepID=A0ACD3A8H8_9AGAR|nr:hypothetical protein BDN72DRAFT_965336 [Pluteus cervinus]
MGGPWILIDDADGNVDYDGDWDLKVKDSHVMLGTFSTCHIPVDEGAALPDKPSILLSSLTGSQVDVYGRILDGTMLNSSVDSAQSQPLQLLASGNDTAQSALIASTELRGSGSHSFKLSVHAGSPVIDYFVVTPRPSPFLSGDLLIIDDNDKYFQYQGNWTHQSGPSTSVGIPFGNTTTGSRTKGDKLLVEFWGSGISLYGALNQMGGKLSLSCVIDSSATVTKFIAFNGSQTVDPNAWSFHQQLFKADLSLGRHQLSMTIDEVTDSQTLWIDYVVLDAIGQTDLTPPDDEAVVDGNTSHASSSTIKKIITVIAIFVAICVFFGLLKRYRQRRSSYSHTLSVPVQYPLRPPQPPPPPQLSQPLQPPPRPPQPPQPTLQYPHYPPFNPPVGPSPSPQRPTTYPYPYADSPDEPPPPEYPGPINSPDDQFAPPPGPAFISPTQSSQSNNPFFNQTQVPQRDTIGTGPPSSGGQLGSPPAFPIPHVPGSPSQLTETPQNRAEPVDQVEVFRTEDGKVKETILRYNPGAGPSGSGQGL